MLNGCIFLSANGVPAERINSVSDEGLKLTMTSSHYMVFRSFGLDHRDMPKLHAVLDAGAGPNLIRSDVLPIGWEQNLVTSAKIPGLGDSNGRPIQLLGAIVLHLRLDNSHFQVPFIVTKHLAASMIIGTEFLDRHVRAIP